MTQWILVSGAILGALAVGTGAFGAHALQGVLDERARGWYDTAVTYHAGHALALVGCGLAALFATTLTGSGNAGSWLNAAGICFVLGDCHLQRLPLYNGLHRHHPTWHDNPHWRSFSDHRLAVACRWRKQDW